MLGKGSTDLTSEIVPDRNLSDGDLAEVEIEVNKRLRKKRDAEKRNEMISPASSVRSNSVPQGFW